VSFGGRPIKANVWQELSSVLTQRSDVPQVSENSEVHGTITINSQTRESPPGQIINYLTAGKLNVDTVT